MDIPLYLPPVEFKTVFMLSEMAREEGSAVRTADLADRMGITVRHMQRVLGSLVKDGIVVCVVRGWYRTSWDA